MRGRTRRFIGTPVDGTARYSGGGEMTGRNLERSSKAAMSARRRKVTECIGVEPRSDRARKHRVSDRIKV